MNYEELVKTLRELSVKNSLSFWKRGVCKDAAAAIEGLQTEVDALKHDLARYVQMNTDLLNEPLQVGKAGNKYTLNEPKRGEMVEVVRCKECIHLTQSGWCDREFDWFPVDENDFCSMAEKMEVRE